MDTYITQIQKNHAVYEGQRIHATSQQEALEKAEEMGVEVIGKLDTEHYQFPE